MLCIFQVKHLEERRVCLRFSELGKNVDRLWSLVNVMGYSFCKIHTYVKRLLKIKLYTYINRNKFEEFKFTFDTCLNEVLLYELRVFRFITEGNTGTCIFIKALNLTFLLVINICLSYPIKEIQYWKRNRKLKSALAV